MKVPNTDEWDNVQEEEEEKVTARGQNPRHLKQTYIYSETFIDKFLDNLSNLNPLKTTLRVRISKNGPHHWIQDVEKHKVGPGQKKSQLLTSALVNADVNSDVISQR